MPGQVKTRLASEISLEGAAALYEAMLLDILDQHAAERDCDRALWFAPPEARPWFEKFEPAGWRVLPQAGPDLASRMATLFRVHASEGYQRIVLRGTDSPTLPAARVAEAFAALERAELALCPDRDGGYNLIGLRTAHDGLFQLELSHAGVLSPDARQRALARFACGVAARAPRRRHTRGLAALDPRARLAAHPAHASTHSRSAPALTAYRPAYRLHKPLAPTPTRPHWAVR